MPASSLVIESRQNPRYKQWRSYAENPEAQDCPWIPVEGRKAVEDLSQTQSIELLLFSDSRPAWVRPLVPRARESFQLSEPLLRRLSDVESFQGAMAFFAKPTWSWKDITPWVVYLDQLQDPSNLGILLRTAAATGVFSVLTRPGTVSCFNRKVIRSSAGLLFSVPFLQGIDPLELPARGYQLWATVPQNGESLFRASFESPLAVLIGNEGRGLEPALLEIAGHRLSIPMHPRAESLNVGVAGSLILYEIVRQKKMYG